MTTKRLHLSAQKRTLFGRAVKKLRQQGQLPANIFGKEVDSTAITIDATEFIALYKQAGETTLVNIGLEGETAPRPVLVFDRMIHPVTAKVLHVDFRQVNLSEKVTANIPIEYIGESPAVKTGAMVVPVYDEIEVEALPTDLPEKFVIDISGLVEIGADFTVGQLEYDKDKVTIALEPDEILITIKAQEEEKIEEVVSEPVEVELTKQGTTIPETQEEEKKPDETSQE